MLELPRDRSRQFMGTAWMYGPMPLGDKENGQAYMSIFCIISSLFKGYLYESRAETHERFYIIEVHRHRFEMSARKVPFEKCTRWRKVCGRSAKDHRRQYLLIFFTISSERFAKGARKIRERRIHSSHVLPKMGCI